jgi:glycosyltransferase involved in cell wall biosynthesis
VSGAPGGEAFGVVIPAFNAEQFLPRALASIAAQTSQPAQVVVVDDGSSDRTAEIARSRGATVLYQANAGPSAARNRGVDALGTSWIAFLDADDTWEPRALERMAQAVRCCPDVRVVFTDYALDDPTEHLPSWFAIDDDYRSIERRPVAPGIVRCDRHGLVRAIVRSLSFVSTSALAVRRDAFLKCGGFDEELQLAEDLDLLLRLFAHSTAAVVEEVLSTYHKHGTNLTIDPIRNGEWELRVCAHAIEHPERYPSAAAELLTKQQPVRLRRAALYALRLARFADAREYFVKSWALQRSALAAGGFAAAAMLDNRLGRSTHRMLRTGWRRVRGTAS